MPPDQSSVMATGRALLTNGERDYLRGEAGDQRKYEARSRVRSRFFGPLADDIELLEEHHPDLLDELREVVCSD